MTYTFYSLAHLLHPSLPIPSLPSSVSMTIVLDILVEFVTEKCIGGGYREEYTYRGGGSGKCIFKWPQDLVQRLEASLSRVPQMVAPQMVAIGPCHHGQEKLMDMEDEKRKALDRLLHSSDGLEKSKFVDALKQVEQELRDHYDDLDPRWSSDSFINMMLLDGCFLLDFLFELGFSGSLRSQLLHTPRYAVLIQDIHLLENQIPVLLLKVLMNVAGVSQKRWSGVIHPSEGLHLLNLQRMSLLGEELYPRRSTLFSALARRAVTVVVGVLIYVLFLLCLPACPLLVLLESLFGNKFLRPRLCEENLQGVVLETLRTIPRRYKYLRSAKKLRASGVTIKKNKPETRNSGVWFDKRKGVLYIPELVLNETSEGVLMNMMAFERMHPESDKGITSFISFMDALIDTAEDVSILGKAGIVTNNLGNDEAAANIFNELGKAANIFYKLGTDANIFDKLGMVEMCGPFNEVLDKVVTYASVPHHGWWVHFKDTYLANPWTFLSLTGALCLLFLAIVQTVYTVLSYYHTNNGSGK